MTELDGVGVGVLRAITGVIFKNESYSKRMDSYSIL